MANGITSYSVLLIVEGDHNKCGLVECLQWCIGSANMTGFENKLNVCKLEEGQTRVVTYFSIFSEAEQEEESDIEEIRNGALMCLAIVDVTPAFT